MSIFTWGVKALVTAKPGPRSERFNPHPPGVIREGSSTAAVLAFLLAHRGKRFSAYQVIHATGCTTKATSWALVYLQRQGLIDAASDPRNERYQRYECNEKTESAQISEPRTQTRKKGLAGNETPVPGAGVQGLSQVRGERDSDRTAMARELRAVPGGRWTAADTGPLAGASGHGSALRAGQCGVDPARAADEPPKVLPQGHRARASHHTSPGRTTTGTADTQHGSAPLGVGLQPGVPEAGQTVPQIPVAHASGPNPAIARVGQADWLASQDPVSAHQEGHAA